MHSASRRIIPALTLGFGLCTQAFAAQGPSESGSARVSNQLNPAISLNALMRGGWRRSDTDMSGVYADNLPGAETGIDLEEAELIMSASVDPYLRADAIVAVESLRGEGDEGYDVDLEEVYVTALALPRGVGLKAGKLYLPFGRHNLLHRHQYPFIDPALVNERVFGHEGLNEVAVELSYLLPTAWFSQLTGALADGRNDALFAGADASDLAFLVHFKNLWDVSADATLELGATALYGGRGASPASKVYGANATYKYRPARQARFGGAWELQAELLHADRAADEDDLLEAPFAGKLTGGYLHARYHAARRWWLQGRYDRVEGDLRDEDRWTFQAAFLPSELSALRFEYATVDAGSGERDHQLTAQLNFTIGSHPAHAY